MLTLLKRVFNFAFADFYRNKGISVAAISVLVITTLLITGIFFLHGMSGFLIETVKNKIDITAYFVADVPEEDILQVRDEILKNSPDIKSVEYVSKEEALDIFNKKHEGNEVFSQALVEVGGNPFLPALNITTSGNPAQYEQVANTLAEERFDNLIEKVDFSQKRDTIEKVFSITSNASKVAWGLGIILILVVLVVVFNTMKLVIDGSKEEIATMRIVGASSWFVRAPFIIEGGIFGFISFILCFFATIAATYFLSPILSVIMPGFNLFNFFLSNLWLVIAIQLGAGVLLGALASLIVVRKYLKV